MVIVCGGVEFLFLYFSTGIRYIVSKPQIRGMGMQ